MAGLVFAVSLVVFGATLVVPNDYPTIQAAINAANPGDTIVVRAGTYEENLNITKSVTISGTGVDSVILQPKVTGYGIGIYGAANNVTIENITIVAGNAKNFMVHVSGVQSLTFQNVKIIGAGKTATPGGQPLGGIDLHSLTGAVIRNVEVRDVSRNGVSLTNSTAVILEGVYVHDTGVSAGWAGVAIYTTVYGSASVTFTGANTVANTPMDVYVMDSPGAVVYLTAPAGTIAFSGQSVAPLVKLGQGSTPDLDSTALGLGLVGKVYASESPLPPYNTGAAFYATVAEALMAAVVDPVQAPYAVVFDLSSNRFVVGPGMQIQRALNAAQTDDKVLVTAGDYVTQALINKGTVFMGESGTVIEAPTPTLRQRYTIAESTNSFDPIIFASGGTRGLSHPRPGRDLCERKGLTIDGQNQALATSPYRFVGILFRNVHGEISGNVIQNMMNPGGVGAGAQTFGVLVYGDSVVDVLKNRVSGFSRGGITILGDLGPAPDPVVQVLGNEVVGNGLESGTGWWAENGVQISYGATGVISGNRVAQCWVNNPAWSASGILAASTDNVVIEGNTALANEIGIGVAGFGVWG